ncbi:hypothetical protein [uncultured Akkermansia sp.]|uniref:hypothetical protein n=1 Tax=uncultured Akkermansia sp. TaxID=512294 RepID=UPI0026239B9E|nr:hypothetical protein [uncultured Akkermansia sp.]
MQNMTDEQIRKTVKDWLRENGRTQAELASQIGLKPQSFRAQMSKSKISSQTKLALMNIIPSSSPSMLPNLDNRGKMELRLDYDTQRRVEKEALRLRMELSAYCTMAVEWCSEQEDIGERLAARLASQQQGTEKQETAKQGLPSHTESSDPATRKRTTEETLGILRIGTNPGAKRKSGSA